MVTHGRGKAEMLSGWESALSGLKAVPGWLPCNGTAPRTEDAGLDSMYTQMKMFWNMFKVCALTMHAMFSIYSKQTDLAVMYAVGLSCRSGSMVGWGGVEKHQFISAIYPEWLYSMLEAQCIAEGSINRFSPAALESGVDLECALVGWHATWMTGSWRGGSKKEVMKSSGRSLRQLRCCHAFFFLFSFFQIPSCIHWRWAGALTSIHEAVQCIDYKRGPSAGTLCDVTSSGCHWPTSCGYCGLCAALCSTKQCRKCACCSKCFFSPALSGLVNTD